MKKQFKRLLAMLLVVVTLITTVSSTIYAEETDQTGVNEVEPGAEKVKLSDEYMSITVSTKNGGFLIATVDGNALEKSDDNKDLLYPSAYYDTSYTSIRVTRTDGSVEDYIFGRDYGFLGWDSSDVEISRSGNSIIAKWSVKDITVTQTLGLLDETASQHGMVSIDYAVTTSRDDVENVKVRIMLDTALGEQDYAFYQVPNVLNEYSSITNETILDNTGENAYNSTFFAIDNPKSPEVNAYTVDVAVAGEMVRPYQVAFGHWNSLASSVFDFAPDASLNFTNQYNTQYMTADSAYALYYDLGEVQKDATVTMSTYYGVYSNSTVSEDEQVAINFTSLPASMTFNEDESAYISQVENGREGDIRLQFLVENLTDKNLQDITVVVKTMNNVTPYEDWTFDNLGEQDSDYKEVRADVAPGEEAAFDVYFNVTQLPASEYRRFEVLCYKGTSLTEGNLIGSREFYLFCPGVLGEVVVFHSLSPQVIFCEGSRRLYISGQNIGLLQDTSAYSTVLHPVAGGEDVVVPSKNVIVDATHNTMHLVIEQEMVPGAYQVIFDWNEAGKESTTATALQFQVSSKPAYVQPTYGVVTIEKDEGFTKNNPKYKVGIYQTEQEYAEKVTDPNNTVFLEFRGNFGVEYDENGNIKEVKAATQKDIYGNISGAISISNCVDIKEGILTIIVEDYGTNSQCIYIDIDGKLYTSKANTKIWNGVCTITPFENGNLNTLLQYKQDGSEVTDVENATANTNAIKLIWPGAASAAQTMAGMVFELRYCEFGMIATKPGSVTSATPKERIISFGAQLSPSFLLPKNFDWGGRQLSTKEAAEIKLAKEKYTARQLWDMEGKYRADQNAWREAKRGSLNLYVDNIIFGSRGFIGFAASIEVGLPSYVDGMPEIEGTLDLKILPALDYWEVGIEGVADLTALKLEAALTLKKAHGGVPGVDKMYFYVEGSTPGINVDGHGIFWIQGLGGGLDGIYDTIYMVSSVPPISLLLSGRFALFAVLEARADLELGLRGFSAQLSEIGLRGISLIDRLGLSIYWYPELKLKGSIAVDILSIIQGGGYIIVEKNSETNSYFWEGFVTASVKTPDIPIIGSITVGSASLGLNPDKVWGALKVIGIDMGVTYYWGGDVDFGFGKYDAPEPTYPISLLTAAVGEDEETGETLYMALGTNATLLAAENTSLGDASVTSSVDRMYHTVELGDYKAYRDLILNMRYTADSLEEAEAIAKGNAYGKTGIKMVAVDDANVSYPIHWLDNSQNAEEQPDANAIFSYDEESKQATVTISVTESEYFAHDWRVTSSVGSDVVLYEMAKMAAVDNVTYTHDESNARMTVNWTGYKLEDMDALSISATDEAGNSHVIYQTEDYAVIAGQTSSGSVTFDLPETLPTGNYTISLTASSEENSICSIVDATGSFSHVNPEQPADPVINDIVLGGDYTLDVDVQESVAAIDGYIATIYEKQVNNGITDWVPSSLGTQYIEADENGNAPSQITLGGQYDTMAYVDADGNVVSEEEAKDRDDVSETTVTTGLIAGKTYRVGLTAYKQDEDGNELVSQEVYTNEILMVPPVKPEVSVRAHDAIRLEDSLDAEETIDYVTNGKVTFTITSDVPVNGEWSLDDGAQSGTFTADCTKTLVLGATEETALEDGEHTLTLTGSNANGDSFATVYRFGVNTTAPRLQISSPFAGSFFGETLHVTGLSEATSKVYVLLDGVPVTSAVADENGAFDIPVAMDETKYSQTISVYAENALGTRSTQYDMKLINEMVGAADVSLAIFVGGKDYTNTIVPAGTAGKVELRVIADGKALKIPENSLLSDQAEWSLTVAEGNATLEDMNLVTDSDTNGMLKVQFEEYDLATVIGGNEAPNVTRLVNLPEEDERYTIHALTDTTVMYGGSFLFEIAFTEGYYPSEEFVVMANGVALTPNDNGVYEITNIFEDIQITVDGIDRKVYTVTLPSDAEGYTITPLTQTTVAHGEKFQFELEIADGYVAGEDFAVKAGGTRLEMNADGSYTIAAVTEDIVVTVEGIEKVVLPDKFIITLPTKQEGYTIIPITSTKVEKGGIFQFKIAITEGYFATDQFVVKVNGVVLKADEDGIYTIMNVTENMTITVEGVEEEEIIPNKYTITLPTEQEGYVVTPLTSTTVTEGGIFQFKVEIVDGYVVADDFAVMANGKELTANKAGIYTITDITEDIEVTVEGVAEGAPKTGDIPANGGVYLAMGLFMVLVALQKRYQLSTEEE